MLYKKIGDVHEYGRGRVRRICEEVKAKVLKEEAKKRGIKTACVKKIDIAKQLPKEVLEELGSNK